jgi:phenylalanyl-tRNA synthetase beta chain
MLVSYNWLKEYIDIDIPAKELADKLYMSGLAVEEVIEKKAEVENVVVARILHIEKHPNADKLSYCDVSDGESVYKVVCGAQNIAEGQTVPLAKIGASLPGGIKIKRTKIRGIESEGMLCSGKELGMSGDHSGILLLDEKKYKLGESFAPSKPDTIFNFEITPNRPDLLSLTGIARLVSAVFKKPVNYPSYAIRPEHIARDLDIHGIINVENLSGGSCPRYSARVIEGVTVKESPEWLSTRLISAGIRPINNIVDVTNYVMLELNQPLHAFDHKKLKDKKIIIRPAKSGEKITALDGKVYSPKPSDLMIADSADAVAIAGVMGGELFSVSPDTTVVILESAFFSPKSVRKTSRSLGVSSDSSYRFERGIDIENSVNALNRAAELMIETGGGRTSSNIIDDYISPAGPGIINLRFERLNKILGTSFSHTDAEKIITDLLFSVQKKDQDSMTVIVPSYRVDIHEEIDLIEDIAQVYGYDNLPLTQPRAGITLGRETKQEIFRKNISSIMVNCGFSQVFNYSFINRKLLKELKAADFIPEYQAPIANPFNEEETHMKTTLLPDMIKNLISNYNKENDNIHLFETANIYHKTAAGEYSQIPCLAALTYGDIMPVTFSHKILETDFYYLKSAVQSIFDSLHTKLPLEYKMSGRFPEFLEYSADIIIGGKQVGIIGQLKEEILYDNKFKRKAWLFEIDLNELIRFYSPAKQYDRLSPYPGVKRDISIIVKNGVKQSDIEAIISRTYGGLISSLRMYDLYTGNPVPEGSKSLTYSIVFQSGTKTLSESEINKAMDSIVLGLKNDINAELRS